MCETYWLGVGKDTKEILKFYKNEIRLLFPCYILIPRKCPRKILFQHTVSLQIFSPSYGLDIAVLEDPLTGPPKSLLLMISRSLPTIKFMTSYEKRFKCARATHSKRPRRAPACGPKERPQPFAPLYAL